MTIYSQQTESQPIYHILPRADWGKALAAGAYAPESLETEGFIHCSTREQVIRVANQFYREQKGLLLLRIVQDQLSSQVLFEDTMSVGENFPHIYGPLDLSAVTALCALEPDEEDMFTMPDEVDWVRLDSDDWLWNADLTVLPYDLAGTVYRSALPFSPMFDPGGYVLDAYHAAGIDLIVMLTQPVEVRRLIALDLEARYLSLGFDVISAPIRDFSVPEQGALDEAIRQTIQAAKMGRTIAIHCHAGLGRTGLFTACLAKVVFGMDGQEARAWVRGQIRDAVETREQFMFVQSFELSEE